MIGAIGDRNSCLTDQDLDRLVVLVQAVQRFLDASGSLGAL